MTYLAQQVVSVLLVAALPADGDPLPRLRLCSAFLTEAVKEATERSPTFRQLSEDIERSTVIVYARVARCPHDVDACLHFLAVCPPHRRERAGVTGADQES